MNHPPSALHRALALGGFIVITFCAPLAGMFSLPGAWYAALNKPSWNPPSWIFGPAWTLLYTLMAIAAWLVWRRDGWRRPLLLFFLNGEKPVLAGRIQVHDAPTLAPVVGQIAGVGRGILNFLMLDSEGEKRDDFGILLE